MQSEYQGHYKPQTFSDIYPYLQMNDVDFPESFAQASPWQNVCAPGMYWTEYCHIGSNRPVRSVVDIEKPIKDLKPHLPCSNSTHEDL